MAGSTWMARHSTGKRQQHICCSLGGTAGVTLPHPETRLVAPWNTFPPLWLPTPPATWLTAAPPPLSAHSSRDTAGSWRPASSLRTLTQALCWLLLEIPSPPPSLCLWRPASSPRTLTQELGWLEAPITVTVVGPEQLLGGGQAAIELRGEGAEGGGAGA